MTAASTYWFASRLMANLSDKEYARCTAELRNEAFSKGYDQSRVVFSMHRHGNMVCYIIFGSAFEQTHAEVREIANDDFKDGA